MFRTRLRKYRQVDGTHLHEVPLGLWPAVQSSTRVEILRKGFQGIVKAHYQASCDKDLISWVVWGAEVLTGNSRSPATYTVRPEGVIHSW